MNPFELLLRWLDRRIDAGIETRRQRDQAAWDAEALARKARADDHMKALIRDRYPQNA